MKKTTKKQLFVVAMLMMLVPLAFLAHIKSLKSAVWDGNDVIIKVCQPGEPEIEVGRCQDADCTDKQILLSVSSKNLNSNITKAHIKLQTTGLHYIIVGEYSQPNSGEYKEFIVTKRSPDRYEYFGCE